MTIILIIGMLYIVVGLLIGLNCLFLKRYDSIDLAIAFTLDIIGILNVIIYHATEAPSALDVYRGKTVLKTTYEDKVPVDTVVIYKKGE